jgi:hypothetical protein
MTFFRRFFFFLLFLFACFCICTSFARAENITLSPIGSGSFDKWEAESDGAMIQNFSFDTASISADLNISSVDFSVTAKSCSGSPAIVLRVKKGDDQTEISDNSSQSLSESDEVYSRIMTADPFTNLSWISDDIGKTNFAIVYHADAGEISVSEVFLKLEYASASNPMITEPIMQNPASGSPDVSLDVHLTIIFPKALDPTTKEGIILKKAKPKAIEIAASVLLDSTGKIATIIPEQLLEPDSEYYLTIRKDKVKYLDGEVVPSWNKDSNQYFITTNGAIPLGVTSISSARSSAQADNDWNHGWQWIFNITIPEDETDLSMKFDDWKNGDNILSSAENVRIFCPQSQGSATPESAKIISLVDSYSQPFALIGDLDNLKTGRQIQIVVEVKIPVGSALGSYSANYSILTSKP